MFHQQATMKEQSNQENSTSYSGPNLVREILDSLGIVAGSLLIVSGIFVTKGGRNLKLN
jgi:hypothetical protein